MREGRVGMAEWKKIRGGVKMKVGEVMKVKVCEGVCDGES